MTDDAFTETPSETLDAPATDTPAPVPVNTPVQTTPTVPTIPMYKTERGFNVNSVQLARDARDNLDKVRIIDIPAPVKKHRIARAEFEAPTLSEVGGGSKVNFCQVVAGKDGRPVNVDDIHYVNTDPTRSNINHGTASVGKGHYLSIGWTMKADVVVLIYEIIDSTEYVVPSNMVDKDDLSKPVAKLTCQLVGFEISSWKTKAVDVPQHLFALLDATHMRMRNDTDFPFYMDIFRIIRPLEEFNTIGINAMEEDGLVYHEADHEFMLRLMGEILDIRLAQYENIPAADKKRKVDTIRIVETFVLDPSGAFIDITLTPIRNDVSMQTFRLRLTQTNFVYDSGKLLIERNLTLDHTTYDKLKIDLESRPEKYAIVQLTSLR